MKVFIITKNRDFTEGRGPMLFHKAFVNKEKMIAYCNTIQQGVYGAKPRNGETFYEYMTGGKDGGWAGYEVSEVEVEE